MSTVRCSTVYCVSAKTLGSQSQIPPDRNEMYSKRFVSRQTHWGKRTNSRTNSWDFLKILLSSTSTFYNEVFSTIDWKQASRSDSIFHLEMLGFTLHYVLTAPGFHPELELLSGWIFKFSQHPHEFLFSCAEKTKQKRFQEVDH